MISWSLILDYSLKNEKPSAIFRIKGLTQQGTPSFSTMGAPQSVSNNTAAIGISVESSSDVDAQMVNLKSKSGGGSGAASGSADMDSMQVEGGEGENMALVRAGNPDTAAHANMALALAPRIGEQPWEARRREDCCLPDWLFFFPIFTQPPMHFPISLLLLPIVLLKQYHS
jgi:hypothetical protein